MASESSTQSKKKYRVDFCFSISGRHFAKAVSPEKLEKQVQEFLDKAYKEFEKHLTVIDVDSKTAIKTRHFLPEIGGEEKDGRKKSAKPPVPSTYAAD